MAVTIPGSGGNWTDISSDQHTFDHGSYRNASRYLGFNEQYTERCTISGNNIYYKGKKQRFFHTTLSAGAAVQSVAANIPKIVDEIKARGVNLVRLHHIDQTLSTAPNGILADSPSSNWYELDSTAQTRLANTIKAIRARGMRYTISLNSFWWNNTSFPPTTAVRGNNINSIVGSNITKVTTGASSTTQTVDSTTGLAAGMELYFGTAAAARTISSVTDATHVVLTSTISTTTDETCYPRLTRFKQLPPINTAASNQLKAFTLNLMATDVSVFPGESGTTIASDPHNLYNTITNEFIPSGNTTGTVGALMDAWAGHAWNESTAADRQAYIDACLDWYNNNWKPWAVTNSLGSFWAWGSDFGSHRTEYDTFKNAIDIKCSHHYVPALGLVGEVLTPGTPQSQANSITDVFWPDRSGGGPPYPLHNGPYILEEWNASDPNRYKAEVILYGAAFAAQRDWAGYGWFDWADGAWDGGTSPTITLRQYQVSHDRMKDSSIDGAASIYLRSDLNTTSLATATNLASENRGAATWLIDTEKTILIAGPQGTTNTFQRSQVLEITSAVDSNWNRGLVYVTAVDNRPIWESRRLKIAHLTDLQRRNRVFSDDFTAITNSGSGAMCVAHGTATITFYTLFPSNVTIYRMNHDGTRGATVSTSANGNLVTFTANNTSTPTMIYEAEITGVSVLA